MNRRYYIKDTRAAMLDAGKRDALAARELALYARLARCTIAKSVIANILLGKGDAIQQPFYPYY